MHACMLFMLLFDVLSGSETEKVLELRRRWSLVQGLPEVAAGKAAEEEAPLTRDGECASSQPLPDMCRCFVCKGLAAAESAQTEAIPLLEMVLAKVASRKACTSNRANMVEPCLPTYALEL